MALKPRNVHNGGDPERKPTIWDALEGNGTGSTDANPGSPSIPLPINTSWGGQTAWSGKTPSTDPYAGGRSSYKSDGSQHTSGNTTPQGQNGAARSQGKSGGRQESTGGSIPMPGSTGGRSTSGQVGGQGGSAGQVDSNGAEDQDGEDVQGMDGSSNGGGSSAGRPGRVNDAVSGNDGSYDGGSDVGEDQGDGGAGASDGPSIPMPTPAGGSGESAPGSEDGAMDAEGGAEPASSGGSSGGDHGGSSSDGGEDPDGGDDGSGDGNVDKVDGSASDGGPSKDAGGDSESGEDGGSEDGPSKDGGDGAKKGDSESSSGGSEDGKDASDGDSKAGGDAKSDEDGKDGDGSSKDGKGDGKDSKNPSGGGKSDGEDSKGKESLGSRIRNAPRNAANAAKNGVKNAVNNTVQGVKNAPKNAVKAAKQGVKNRVNAAKNAALDKTLGAVREQAQKAKRLAKATAQTAKNIAKGVKNGVMAVAHAVQFMCTPAGWGSAILVVVMIITLGLLQTLGPSVIDCDTSAGSQSSGDDSGSSSSTENVAAGDFKGEAGQAIWKTLVDELGFSGPGAAGALANAMRESSLNPKSRNDAGGVAGLFQWSGYTSDVNGGRIRATGKIKPGDDSTLTVENEMELLKHELNGGYSKVKDIVGKATDPHQAAWDWCKYFEGVDPASDDQAAVGKTNAWADQACDAYNCKSVKADESKLGANTGPGVSSDGDSGLASNIKEVFCGTDSSDGDAAMNGAVSGSQQCDGKVCDFSWMCDAMSICHNGDYGVITPVAGYQCVWYAWTRAVMVHKGYGSTWSTVSGDGGTIWANAKGRAGWTVDETPHAGDILSMGGISGYGHVVFVEKVEKDGNGWKIYISEGNVVAPYDGQWKGYRTRWMTQSEVSGLGGHFVRHDSWK